jgi:hypothetical protein
MSLHIILLLGEFLLDLSKIQKLRTFFEVPWLLLANFLLNGGLK